MGVDFAGWANEFWFFEVKFRGSGAAKSRLKLSISNIKKNSENIRKTRKET